MKTEKIKAAQEQRSQDSAVGKHLRETDPHAYLVAATAARRADLSRFLKTHGLELLGESNTDVYVKPID
jgi:hypothetical protein